MDWTKLDDRRAILYFENKTGILDWTPPEVARWLQEHSSIVMPTPPTPLELLTQRIARAAGRALDRDDGAPVDHRVHLTYREEVAGDVQRKWVDIDSPTLTPEKLADSVHLRREQALNILVRAAADVEHIKRTRPGFGVPVVDGDLAEEVKWRLNTPGEDGQQGAKVG